MGTWFAGATRLQKIKAPKTPMHHRYAVSDDCARTLLHAAVVLGHVLKLLTLRALLGGWLLLAWAVRQARERRPTGRSLAATGRTSAGPES